MPQIYNMPHLWIPKIFFLKGSRYLFLLVVYWEKLCLGKNGEDQLQVDWSWVNEHLPDQMHSPLKCPISWAFCCFACLLFLPSLLSRETDRKLDLDLYYFEVEINSSVCSGEFFSGVCKCMGVEQKNEWSFNHLVSVNHLHVICVSQWAACLRASAQCLLLINGCYHMHWGMDEL